MSRAAAPISTRLPALDGVRALAVLLVMLSHSLWRFPETAPWLPWLAQGALGVQLFFVLSGYLITTLLLRERDRTGRISLSSFYMRRARRILPAFLAYVAVIALLQALGLLNIPLRYYAYVLSQTWNYQVLWNPSVDPTGHWYFGHYWSLALEEQFYLLWPLLLIMVSTRQLKSVLPVVLVLMPVVRIFWYHTFPAHRGALGMFFHTACDTLLWGAWLALVLRDTPRWLHQLTASRVLRVVVLIIAFGLQPWAVATWHGAWSLPAGLTLNALCGVFLVAMLRVHDDWHWFFAARWVVFVGSISYSLYLWQQLYLAAPGAGGPVFSGFWAFVLVVTTAVTSWKWIEQPFLKKTNSVERVS